MLTWRCKPIGMVPIHWATWGKIPVAVVSPHPEGWGLLLLHAHESGIIVKFTLEEAQAEVAEWVKFNAPTAPADGETPPPPTQPARYHRDVEIELLDCSNQNIPIVKSMLQVARDKGWTPLFSVGQLVYLERPLEPPCDATTPRSSRLSSSRASRRSSGGRRGPQSRGRCTS